MTYLGKERDHGAMMVLVSWTERGGHAPERFPCRGCQLAPRCTLAYDVGNLDKSINDCERERRC